MNHTCPEVRDIMGRKRQNIRTFYDIQKKQRKIAFLLFFLIFVTYFIFMGILTGVTMGILFLLFRPDIMQGPQFLYKLAGATFIVSLAIALGHYLFGRLQGSTVILQVLAAENADPNDLYHKRFLNIVEELRIASGLPQIDPYIIPSPAVNSMSLIQAHGRPAIIASEGLVGKCTREELQAVLAHELAHILRGDTHLLTMVCSMRALFDKLSEKVGGSLSRSSEQGRGLLYGRRGFHSSGRGGGLAILVILFAISLTASLFMNILTTFLSRKREIAADARAVEITRDPLSLAMAIYKAHSQHSFMGDFCGSYTPLFIVSPSSRGYSLDSSRGSHFWDSHPPLKKRLEILTSMANIRIHDIVKKYWQQKEDKKNTSPVIYRKDTENKMVSEENGQTRKSWEILDKKNNWRGPFPLNELLRLPFFAPSLVLRNQEHGIMGNASSIPQFEQFFASEEKEKGAISCPVCQNSLQNLYYEGAPVYECPHGHGRMLSRKQVTKIILREETVFADDLKKEAARYKKENKLNPQKTGKKGEEDKLPCPGCRKLMKYRPYNYQYYVMIHECFYCQVVWFEGQSLEILQILVEEESTSLAL